MDKQELRINILNQLKKLTPETKKVIEHKLYNRLYSTKKWKYANIIGITMSKSFEWNTKPIIEQAWKQQKKIVIPKVDRKNHSLNFLKIESLNDLKLGHFQILEPKPTIKVHIEKTLIDLLIVPGIVFDHRGYRIGFGGGYFDRFLINFPNETLSLVDRMQIVDYIPNEKHDIPVKTLVTTDKIVQSGGNRNENG